jgi:ribosome-associated protein
MTDSDQKEEKSRSQIKREFRELKNLGKQLVCLPEGSLRALPLSERTRDAILAAKTMTRTALQRQLRYLSSLLSEEDVISIRVALERRLQPHADEVAALHQAERWREDLLSGDDDLLSTLVEQHPGCDRQHLRQLVRNARKERELGKPARSARQLFRYLKRLAESGPEPRSGS